MKNTTNTLQGDSTAETPADKDPVTKPEPNTKSNVSIVETALEGDMSTKETKPSSQPLVRITFTFFLF